MNLGPHSAFILASYAAVVVSLGAIGLWVWLDYRVQRRALSLLESEGVTRRSGRPVAEDAR